MGRWIVLGLLAAMALAVPACGNDDGEDEGDDGTGGATGTGGAAPTATECDPAGEGVCQNDTDCPLVENGEARSTASSCGVGCLQDADPAACSEACVVAESGLSADCASCYVAIVECSRENCLVECASDPDSDDCFTCQVANDCRAEFDTCSGLETGG